MKNKITLGKCILSIMFVFVMSALISAMIWKLISIDRVYFPIDSIKTVSSATELLTYVSKLANTSGIQIILIFLSGFSVLAFYTSLAIFVYRGVSFGYAIAAISEGAVLNSLGDKFELMSSAPILVAYLLSGAVVLMFSIISVRYSEGLRGRCSFKSAGRFTFQCLVYSGIVLILDTAKVYFV